MTKSAPGSVLNRFVGLPCWGVRRSTGSIFFMNFGEPALDVSDRTITTSEGRARRPVHVVGEGYLRIDRAAWRLFRDGTEVVWAESEQDDLDRALRDDLEGQRLLGWDVDRASLRLRFDLGTEIETWPWPSDTGVDEEGEPILQWTASWGEEWVSGYGTRELR